MAESDVFFFFFHPFTARFYAPNSRATVAKERRCFDLNAGQDVLTVAGIVVFLRTDLWPAWEQADGRWEALHLPGSASERRRQLPRDAAARAELRESGRGAEKHSDAAERDDCTAEGNHLQTGRHHQRADDQTVPVRLSHGRQEFRQGRNLGEGEAKHHGRCSQRPQ